MDITCYDLMDWAGIEEIVYSEAADPHRLLGPHITEEGLLIQTYIPTAVGMKVKFSGSGQEYEMEMMDNSGFFAVLVPEKEAARYTLAVTYDNDTTEELYDPYAFETCYTEEDLKKFGAGIHYRIYDKMGAHPMKLHGIDGVYFSVWAPCAMRVSVVGDFNLWDGRRHQMRRQGESGIFDLFIPRLAVGTIYKYEIKNQRGEPQLKSDPYASYGELRPNSASVIWDLKEYHWQDKEWMTKRAKTDSKSGPMSIYEVHLGSWIRKEVRKDELDKDIVGSEFYNYREIAVKLAEYVKEMGFTHVELMPVMEHPLDASWGYQVTGYYAPTSRYGTPDDFMFFMDYLHGKGIGVILDWVPAHFPRDSFGLANFDGTCVYEHKDPRNGSHPHWGTLIYNYGRPGVSNFLIANALYWVDKYHADAIRMDAVASMLYLDYGKNDGEWIPNIYGGHENLEAVDFLKHLNSVFKGRKDGAVLIAEESTAWPKVTGDVKADGLGFDYKWNMGWMNDFTGYMQCEPFSRKYHYGELTFSMLYAYSEDFILVLSHDEVVHGKGSMIGKMPGGELEDKAANLRAAYGFMISHPGKKLLFMGQEFAQIHEWNENAELNWELLSSPVHSSMKEYVKALNQLYTSQPALYQKDYETEGFEWINCSDSKESILIFLRKTKKKEETLLIVCNFDRMLHEKFPVGVPFNGKYKELLNSDAEVFGGEGYINARAKTSRKVEADERPDSIQITVAPLSVQIFGCTPVAEEKKAGKSGKTESKKGKSGSKTAPASAGKKAGAGKTAVKSAVSVVKKAVEKAVEKTEEKKAPGSNQDQKSVAEKFEGKEAVVEKIEAQKSVIENTEDKKPVAEKIEDKKAPIRKIADKKPTAEKIEDKKAPIEKIADKKPAAEKIEDKKAPLRKIADKKPTAEKIEDKKAPLEKIADKKLSTEKIEDKKAPLEKIADKKLSAEKIEDKKVLPGKKADKKLSTREIADKEPLTEKVEANKPHLEKSEDKEIPAQLEPKLGEVQNPANANAEAEADKNIKSKPVRSKAGRKKK